MLGSLSQDPQEFPQKRHFLSLFSFYIKRGNIYAIVAAHNASFIRTIFDEVRKVPGDMGLFYGQMIFPQLDVPLENKK